MRALVVVVTAALLVGGTVGGAAGGSVGGSVGGARVDAPGGAAVSYVGPVSPVRVARAFVAPESEFGAGHRGVDLATTPATAVGSAGAGVVTFAGTVAGRGLVVVAHADGVSTEYEPVRPAVSAGMTVHRGQLLGRIRGTHGTCAPGSCLHWGARRGGAYFDPMLLLRPLGEVRLLPWSSSA